MYKDQPSVHEDPVSFEDTSPRPFGEIPPLWLKVVQMTEDFFAQEAPRASASNTMISVLIMAVATAIFSAISALINIGIRQVTGMSVYDRDTFVVGIGGAVVCSLCGGLLGTVLGFYLSNGLTYLGARVFGGSGDYGSQTYLQSLFFVPVGIVMSAVALVNGIPIAGPCIVTIAALALAIYSIVLNVRAIKVVHNLTTGKAVAAVFAPALIIVILACILIGMLTLLGPVIGDIFDEIIYSLQ
jgi:hypothetical protein